MTENTLQRITVGFGGDARSHDALALGIALARAADARLDIVLILRQETPFAQAYPPVGSLHEILNDQARQWIHEAEALVPTEVEHRSHVWTAGSVARGLITAVEELDSDLLVTGSGISFGGLTTHSTVTALVHSSPVPVALAPSDYPAATQITNVMAAVSTTGPEHQVSGISQVWATQLSTALTFVTFQDRETSPSETQEYLPSLGASESGEHIIATGRTLRHAVSGVDWPRGAILLVGSSPLARKRHLFLGVTAARVLSHLPIPMVLLPRDPQSAHPPTR